MVVRDYFKSRVSISKTLMLLVILVFISCSKNTEIDDPKPPISPPTDTIVENPVYDIQKEKIYIATIKGYRDEIKSYYYKYTVTQTNPKVTIPDSIIKFKEDSINNLGLQPMFIAQRGQLVIPDVGIEINKNSFDRMLRIFAYLSGNGINFNTSYISLGRDSLLNLFSKGHIEGHITTFENMVNELSSYLWSPNIIIEDETWDIAYGDSPEFGLNNGFDYQAFLYNKNVQLPEVNIKEYLFVYDRFHNRNFIDDKGNIYTTRIILKKLTDIENFDVTAKYQVNKAGIIDPVFQFDKLNPVIQLYKGEQLIFEGKIEKYTEEWDKNGFSLDKTRTNIEFRANTLKNKLFYTIQYFSYYSTYFQIRGIDFANPDPGEDFSTKYNEIITIVDDNKNNDKKTVSFE